MKSYRFFYHFNKQTRKMTVHFKGTCIPVDDIQCMVPCETKWSTRQPYLVMQGWAKNVAIVDGKAVIV